MNKKSAFLAVMLCVLFPVVVLASPFLVCDPYPTTGVQPAYFSIVPDGGAAIASTPELVTGGAVRLHHDMAGVTTGIHNWTVAACNEWGCSSAVPFGFTKSVPGAPANIRSSSN
jgi:hypothetical protein